ncbi:MAG: outer membrane beta-barrel protein [Bacteroidales bacterium]|nr:outer membrane beta-barrel protein [Bacteroidales bacterium]
MIKFYSSIILFALTLNLYSQKRPKLGSEHDVDTKNLFGLSISPVLAGNTLENNNYNFQSDTIAYSITHKISYSFGAEIRHYFTYRFALNSGIYYTKRNIQADFSSQHSPGYYKPDTAYTENLKFVAFEIPLVASGYVRLGKDVYMSINGGFNLNFYPSDIKSGYVGMQRLPVKIFGKDYININFFQLGFTAGIGWEYRTKDDGYFYIGTTYQTRIRDMAYLMFYEQDPVGGNKGDFFTSVSGSYLSINFKYYFSADD